jgi:hypothetical protein
MADSILTSTKKALGIAEDYTAFDPDILMHINSVFVTLNQLGIGPASGFMIEDDTVTWDTFLGDDLRLNNVKTYVFLRVRVLFDPPSTSYLLDAMQKQIAELEWRMNVYRESTGWVDPDPDTTTTDWSTT